MRLMSQTGSIAPFLTLNEPLPVYREQRTSSERPGWSVWCHNRTHGLQQTQPHSITSSARKRNPLFFDDLAPSLFGKPLLNY
jgi:hypothetical protein